MISWIAVATMCALRLALWGWKRVGYSPEDETSVLRQATGFRWSDYRMMARFYTICPDMWDAPGPLRVGSLLLLGAVLRLVPGHRGMALVSTLSGCVCVVVGEAIALRLHAPPGLGAVLVGSCPLVLGLGRRALQDVPMLALQMIGMLVIDLGPEYAPAAWAVLVAGLCFKESAIPGLAGLFAWACWRWGGFPLACVVFATALGTWYAGMSVLVNEPLHRFVARLVRRAPSTDPYKRLIRGGPHRLLVDLVLVMPVGVLAGARYIPSCGWAAVLGAALGGYGLFILQEIRIALLLSVLLRLALAVFAPWWVVALCTLCDAYVYYRVWYRQDLYDPTTVWLAQFLEMGP